MGEATYYAKVFFNSEEEAKTALEPITAFIQEGQKAEDFWQSNRGKTPGEFWPEFEKQFPTVTEYTKGINLFGGDCNNKLAGQLDFGSEEEEPYQKGNAICYTAYVWHFADWTPMLDFIMNKWNATDFKWISDEDADLMDLL